MDLDYLYINISKSRATKKEFKNVINILRKERKQNHIKYSIQTTKKKKKIGRQNRNKGKGQPIENSNEYGNINTMMPIVILSIPESEGQRRENWIKSV